MLFDNTKHKNTIYGILVSVFYIQGCPPADYMISFTWGNVTAGNVTILPYPYQEGAKQSKKKTEWEMWDTSLFKKKASIILSVPQKL